MADESMADPDAMWKQGYGAPGPADPREAQDPDDVPRAWFANYGRTVNRLVAEPPESTPESTPEAPEPPVPLSFETDAPNEPGSAHGLGARRPVVAGLAVVGLAVVVVTVGGVVRQGNDDNVGNDGLLASIPSEAAPTWTAVLDTGGINGVVGTGSTIVVLESVTNDLVGLTAASGVERWRVNTAPSNSIATLELVEEAAIVLVERNTGDRSVAAYDLGSGERLWRENGFDQSTFTVFLGSLYRLPGGDTDVVELIDPRTGAGLNRLNAFGREFLNSGWAHVATTSDDSVEVFDLQNLERVAGPIADADMVAATVFDGRVVGLGPDGTVRVHDSTGVEQSSLPISIDQPDLFDVTNTPEPVLVVLADNEIVGYALTGERIAEVWRMGAVQVNDITDVGDHTYAVVQPVVAAGATGGPVRVVDAATGDAVAQPSGGSRVRFGSDGFVVEITDDEDVREAIEAYGYDGERRWRFDLTIDQKDLFLVDGAMVVVASDFVTDKSTLTYLH